MARSHHTHIITREYDKPWTEGEGKYKRSGVSHIRVALCGDESSFLQKWTEDKRKSEVKHGDPQHGPKCPECAKLYWAEKVKDLPYKLERWPIDKKAEYLDRCKTKYSRSVWKVLLDGKHIASIWLESGWGAGWRVGGWEWERGKNPAYDLKHVGTVDDVQIGGSLRQAEMRCPDEALYFLHHHLMTRDKSYNYGVLPLEEFVERGNAARVKNIAAEKQRKIEQAEREKERKAEEAREKAERDEHMDQLRDLAARKDLTNYQRDGLEWALEHLKE